MPTPLLVLSPLVAVIAIASVSRPAIARSCPMGWAGGPGAAGVSEIREAVLGSGCPAAFGGDGSRTFDEVSIFIEVWFGQDPRADANIQFGVNIDVLFIYLAGWFGGCA
jgi:hypothetical protein